MKMNPVSCVLGTLSKVTICTPRIDEVIIVMSFVSFNSPFDVCRIIFYLEAPLFFFWVRSFILGVVCERARKILFSRVCVTAVCPGATHTLLSKKKKRFHAILH
jgi:hypothetical protein